MQVIFLFHHGAASRERKLTMTLLIVTVVSFLLYLPVAIFHIVDFVNPSSKLVYMDVQLSAVLIVLCKQSCKSNLIHCSNARLQKSSDCFLSQTSAAEQSTSYSSSRDVVQAWINYEGLFLL